MIDLIPAIDIIGGECVRLTKGDYSQKKVYNANPVAVAQEFAGMGFKRLHMVDLDGAKSKHVVNADVLHAVAHTPNLCVDFGGGIKTQEDMDKVFDNGAKMATVGSISYTDPSTFEDWIKRYGPNRIILGADVRNKNIAINGWLNNTDCDVFQFIDHYRQKGITKVLCTDISKDGALGGTSIDLYKQLMQRFPDLYLIASGGVSSAEDIISLDEAGIPAVVFGKAYYEGLIDINKIRHLLYGIG